MSYKKQFLNPSGFMLSVTCWCALASGSVLADTTNDESQTKPPLMAAPSSAPQLRPLPETSGTTLSAPNPAAPPSPGDTSASSGTGPDGSLPGSSPSLASDSTPVPSPGDVAAASSGSSGAAPNAWKSSYVNLVNLLVSRGVLTKKDSSDLVTQAEHDAQQASAATAEAAAAAPAPSAAPAASSGDDTMKVGYVPETVKEQIRDEIKDDVMQQARDEGWAAPDTTPDWVTRYRVSADLRVRYEGQFYPGDNDTSGSFYNFDAVNSGSPVNLMATPSQVPANNVDQNRDRFRLRARIGADVDVGQGFSAGLRVGTGSDDNPVTENQTLGGASGQGGNFSKYQIWLDRAFLKYQIAGARNDEFSATVGRFDNPFMSTSMIWADDIGFDGFVVKGKYEITDGFTPFLTAGAFPVYNTDLNFGTDNPSKFSSEDKYLMAAQLGVNRQITDHFTLKVAAAYYYFDNIEGKVSSPFDPANQTSANTDDSRPSFAQNGNTYIALRDIVPANGGKPTSDPQYFGLATPFHDLALTGQLDYDGFDPFHISVIAEAVRNLAFDRTAIENNGPATEPLGLTGPVNNLSSSGTFAGGNVGYDVRLNLGHPSLEKLWDWNVSLTYRYVESDATVDAFTDADFGGSLTGTNLKGYILGGKLALTPRVALGANWMSADAIAGPTYRNDLLQFDINAKF